MSNGVCPNCEKHLPLHAVYCQACGEIVGAGTTDPDGTQKKRSGRSKKKPRSLGAQIFAAAAIGAITGGTIGAIILFIGLSGSEPATNTNSEMVTNSEIVANSEIDMIQSNNSSPTRSPNSQFSSPGVDHAEEMETCRQEIEKLVASIVSWQWGALTTFGNRRVRRATVSYVPYSGPARVDGIVCTFDAAPVGNDFFINR